MEQPTGDANNALEEATDKSTPQQDLVPQPPVAELELIPQHDNKQPQ